ncbi:MAG: hypothetical protein VR70_08240 [Rhodospirillaceae bacterium BRH_c57]|nr:MAG: hypothetical protein VR70_08240 [Rhodospirillaceae bacterium BRH_c57]
MSIVYRLVLAIAIAITVAPGLATAQQHDHGHNEEAAEKIGQYEAELDVKGNEVTLHLRDAAEKEVSAEGFKATAVVLSTDGPKTIELQPSGGNALSGKGNFTYSGKFRATVTLTGPSGVIGKGRYNFVPGE